MPRLIRNLRARSFAAVCWLAMLLAVVGMASIALENVSFGHDHLDGGHALHHHHAYLGAHEHPHDDHGEDHDHDHGVPAPEDGPAQQRTATVSTAPALFQPAPVHVLAAGPADSGLLVPILAPRPAARFVLRSTPPRGPPLSSAGPRL